MVGAGDVELLRRYAAALPAGATAVEFGPWLGALSVILAPKADLHVVDSFLWTKDHARKVPDLLNPGESFRPAFEAVLDQRGLKAHVHETEFAAFRWPGGPIGLVLVDAPKKADDLHTVLSAVAGSLAEGAPVLVKNGLNPQYPDLMDYAGRLAAAGAVTIDPAENAGSGNILIVRATADAADIATLDWRAIALNPDGVEGGDGHEETGAFLLSRLAGLAEANEWRAAYARLSAAPPDPDATREWDNLEAAGAFRHADPMALATFSEILAQHNAPALLQQSTTDFAKSQALAQRGWWINTAAQEWRGDAFEPELIARTQEFGYMKWPARIAEWVAGQDVLEPGCGQGLHGLGYLAAGARSYFGVDPALIADRDKVKNLTTRSRTGFGWTPAEIAARVKPWRVQASGLERAGGAFDIAVLHDTTEHLLDIEDDFARIAALLRPGGRILFMHHNYYSWNGHHQAPKRVSDIGRPDPDGGRLADWGHVSFDPPAGHYIARSLNRIRLDDLLALTARHFDIEIAEETRSSETTGLGRLTPAIRARHSGLGERDFTVQNLFCVARKA
ncbi:MAG: methyltransferase domain-containing protein [Paracoccaceae bacterium]